MGDSFTGQKTQPTVSKYWRKKRYKSKENPEKANNTKYSNTINRHTYNPLDYNTMGWLADGSQSVAQWAQSSILHRSHAAIARLTGQLLLISKTAEKLPDGLI